MRSIGVIPNRCESVRKLVKKLGAVEELRFCYEAGPTGYVLYWQLTALDAKCEVVAPTLVPVGAGDRVKTDRRDALKLARSYRGRANSGMGAGCRTRGLARSGKSTRSCQETNCGHAIV